MNHDDMTAAPDLQGARICSGQSRGPRHWSWCHDARPCWRPEDARGRVRLWSTPEAAQRALDAQRALEPTT